MSREWEAKLDSGRDPHAINPHSRDWRDGWNTRDAENAVVQQEERAKVLAEVRRSIESHPFRCPVHGMTDCSPLLNGCSIPNQAVAWALAALGDTDG